jgi:TPR repeat protein
MFNLRVLYERGLGVSVDLAMARTWYQRAAAHNHPDARSALKRLGWKGQTPDPAEAAYWYALAAANGEANALTNRLCHPDNEQQRHQRKGGSAKVRHGTNRIRWIGRI